MGDANSPPCDSGTLLSRSGQTSASGKLIDRFDIPVSEELNERAIIAAAHAGKPKAELLRDILSEALENGCWFRLSMDSRKALEVLSALYGESPGQVLTALVNDALVERFAMHKMMALQSRSRPSDEYRVHQA